MSSVKDRQLLFHLTSLNNLDSILTNGLLSRKDLSDRHIGFSDIADTEIIRKRHFTQFDQYVLFHFKSSTPFDKAVLSEHEDEPFIYICVKRDTAQRKNYRITPQHPLSNGGGSIYSYEEGFNEINWNAMDRNSNDYTARQTQMAECLSPEPVMPDDFFIIYVENDKDEQKVIEQYKMHGISELPIIRKDPKFFRTHHRKFAAAA